MAASHRGYAPQWDMRRYSRARSGDFVPVRAGLLDSSSTGTGTTRFVEGADIARSVTTRSTRGSVGIGGAGDKF